MNKTKHQNTSRTEEDHSIHCSQGMVARDLKIREEEVKTSLNKTTAAAFTSFQKKDMDPLDTSLL